MSPIPRAVTAALAWAAAVVGATAIGLTAVGAIGVGIVGSGSRPLDAAEVDRLLADPVAPGGSGTTAPAPTSAATAPLVLAGPGGTVLARCADGVVEVVSASPAQGFRVHDEGGGDAGRVRFEAEETEVEMRLSCVDGEPVSDTRVDD